MPEDESALAIRAHETAALDVQVLTAQKLGRTMRQFAADLESWACATPEIAQECTYLIKKGGTKIIGPSIRFAELMMVAWRHLVIDTFIEREARDHIVVGCMARDLFRNTAVRARVRRNILKKDGKTRYTQDVIQSTVQAAASVAMRNAIIRLVPKALWLPVWLRTRDVAQGRGADGKPVIPFRERAFEFLTSFGATEDQVLTYLEKPSRLDLDADDIVELQNKARSIRAGEVDVDAAFPPPDRDDRHGVATAEAVADRIKTKQASDAAPPAKKKATRKRRARPAAEAPTPPVEPEPEPEPEPEEPSGAGDDIPAIDL